MDNIILNVENIRKSYGKHEVLKGVCLSCAAGQCVGIVGANGSGKSTLLSVIAGTQRADEGSVIVCGEYQKKASGCANGYIGYVPQENPLIEDLSVMDNLRLWYCDSPYDLKRELAEGFLKELGINEYAKKPVKKLSGGMKKRVSVAIAVHNKPKILLLDEPGAALDISAKNIIRSYLKSYIKAGGTVVLVTHDEEELSICDTVYTMSDGVLKEAEKK